jgi:hypothetical protein
MSAGNEHRGLVGYVTHHTTLRLKGLVPSEFQYRNLTYSTKSIVKVALVVQTLPQESSSIFGCGLTRRSS